MFSQEYHQAKNRSILSAKAIGVLFNLNIAGFWVKDMDFKFMDISEVASDILYGMKSEDCVGKTDFEIARDINPETDEKQFAEVCRASDKYVLDNPIGDKYYSYTFVELLRDTKGNPHIWQVIKGVHPEEVGEGKYFYGFARFMDVATGSFDNALHWFEKERKSLTKLNENLYIYSNY